MQCSENSRICGDFNMEMVDLLSCIELRCCARTESPQVGADQEGAENFMV